MLSAFLKENQRYDESDRGPESHRDRHQIAELAAKQANVHNERASFYAKQVELYAGVDNGNPGIAYSSNQDPKAAASAKQEEHQQRADHLKSAPATINPFQPSSEWRQ